MPATKPIFMDEVRTNGAGLYVGLYYYNYAEDGSSTLVHQYYWLPTNITGEVRDKRSNKILVGGSFWWSDKETALLNIPAGYSGLPAVDAFESTKNIGYMNMFPEADFARTKTEYAEAASKGFDEIVVNIKWNGNNATNGVFATYTAQFANSGTSWQYYDELINYAAGLTNSKGKKMNVSIRFIAAIDDGSHYDLAGAVNTSGFCGLSNMAKDHLGYPARVAEGIGQISLANSLAIGSGGAVAQALDFVTKGLQRYYPMLNSAGSKLAKYSVGTAAQFEYGYGYENQHYEPPTADNPTARYPTTFDYSTFSKEGFRTYIQAQTKYNTIEKVNAAWGTTFFDYAAIQPPVGSDTSIYGTAIGLDWWLWNNQLNVNFQTACYNLKATYAPNSKFVLEPGSCSDNLSPKRMTLDVLGMSAYSDMLKAQFGRNGSNTSLAISLDVIRSNYTKKIGTELNYNDAIEQGGQTTFTGIRDWLVYNGEGAIENDAKDLLFIGNKANATGYSALMAAADILIPKLNANSNARIIPNTEIQYSITTILSNYNAWFNSWAAVGDNSRRVKMTQTNNIIVPTPSTCLFPFSLYDNQNFCLSNDSIKSDIYFNAGEFSETQNAMNTTHFRLLAPTHSITYQNGSVNSSNFVSGDLAKCNWSIKGETDGIYYVKNTQTAGFFSLQNGSNPKENNHPSKRNIGHIGNDSEFYIPIAGQSFRVYIENTGAVALTFMIDVLNPNSIPSLTKVKVAAGASANYLIDMASVEKSSIKQIKVNCNRDSETDSL